MIDRVEESFSHPLSYTSYITNQYILVFYTSILHVTALFRFLFNHNWLYVNQKAILVISTLEYIRGIRTSNLVTGGQDVITGGLGNKFYTIKHQ